MKYRISKATLSKLPAEIAQAIKDVQARYTDHTGKPYFHSFTYRTQNEGFKMWHGEGEFITYVYGDNKIAADIQSENDYSGSKITYGPPCPAGTVIIQVSYYQGYYMTVTNVGGIGIEGK